MTLPVLPTETQNGIPGYNLVSAARPMSIQKYLHFDYFQAILLSDLPLQQEPTHYTYLEPQAVSTLGNRNTYTFTVPSEFSINSVSF